MCSAGRCPAVKPHGSDRVTSFGGQKGGEEINSENEKKINERCPWLKQKANTHQIGAHP